MTVPIASMSTAALNELLRTTRDAGEARGYARAMRDAEAWHRARAAELLADERAGHAREIVDAHLRSANAFAAMATRPRGNGG